MSFFILLLYFGVITLTSVIERFAEKGEKTGWTYLYIPQSLAQQIKPNCKVAFRVKGFIDSVCFSGIALAPMGGGDFILPLKKELQKKIGKRKDATVSLQITEDTDFKLEMPADLAACLEDAEGLTDRFFEMPKSHQNYYFNWINAAKTDATRIKRIAQTIEAMELKMNYGEMIRYNKSKK